MSSSIAIRNDQGKSLVPISSLVIKNEETEEKTSAVAQRSITNVIRYTEGLISAIRTRDSVALASLLDIKNEFTAMNLHLTICRDLKDGHADIAEFLFKHPTFTRLAPHKVANYSKELMTTEKTKLFKLLSETENYQQIDSEELVSLIRKAMFTGNPEMLSKVLEHPNCLRLTPEDFNPVQHVTMKLTPNVFQGMITLIEKKFSFFHNKNNEYFTDRFKIAPRDNSDPPRWLYV